MEPAREVLSTTWRTFATRRHCCSPSDPLTKVVRHRNIETVGFLLDSDADINYYCTKAETALLVAATQGVFEVKLLLKRGARINGDFLDGKALVVATQHSRAVQLLLENGAKTEASDMYSATALMWHRRGGRNLSGC